MAIVNGSKRCGRCRTVKTTGEFYTDRGGCNDGIAGWCKVCRCEDERNRRRNPRLINKFHTKYELDMAFRSRELLRAVQKRCRRNGRAFDLDIPWLSERLISGKCELTGLPFDFSVRTRKPQPYTPSIDRIIPSLGYTKPNCRVVIFAVNAAMRDWGLQVVLRVSKALISHQGYEVPEASGQ